MPPPVLGRDVTGGRAPQAGREARRFLGPGPRPRASHPTRPAFPGPPACSGRHPRDPGPACVCRTPHPLCPAFPGPPGPLYPAFRDPPAALLAPHLPLPPFGIPAHVSRAPPPAPDAPRATSARRCRESSGVTGGTGRGGGGPGRAGPGLAVAAGPGRGLAGSCCGGLRGSVQQGTKSGGVGPLPGLEGSGTRARAEAPRRRARGGSAGGSFSRFSPALPGAQAAVRP